MIFIGLVTKLGWVCSWCNQTRKGGKQVPSYCSEYFLAIESKMNPPGPEYQALEQCSSRLVVSLQQSPGDIILHIRPSGILAPRDITFFRDSPAGGLEKAERLVSIVMMQTKSDPQVYSTFITALKAAGNWTKSAVAELEQTYTKISGTDNRKESNTCTSLRTDNSNARGSVDSGTTGQVQTTLNPDQLYSQATGNYYQGNQFLPGKELRSDNSMYTDSRAEASLEARVKDVCIEDEKSQSAFAGTYRAHWPRNGSQASSVSRYEDELPKLDPAESVTNESGFGEDLIDLGPVASEGVAPLGDYISTLHYIPPVSSSQDYWKTFVSQGAGVLSMVEEKDEENATVNSAYEPTYRRTEPISEAAFSENHRELVLSYHQQRTTTTAAATHRREKSIELELVRSENASNILKIEQLSEQLAASEQSESRLKREVVRLKEENLQLEYELRTSKDKAKRSEEKVQREMVTVKSKLHEKEAEVKKLREKLGAAEWQNEVQTQEYLGEIRKLEKERSELQSAESKLKEKDEQNRQLIWDLKEKLDANNTELNKKRAELADMIEQKCALEVKLANQRAELAEERAERKAEAKYRKMELEQERNKAKMEQMEEDLKFHRENSVPKHLFEQAIKKMEEKNFQQVQSTNSLTSTPYTGQTSLTESAQPSPSVSSEPPDEHCINDSFAQAINFSAEELDDDGKSKTQGSNDKEKRKQLNK